MCRANGSRRGGRVSKNKVEVYLGQNDKRMLALAGQMFRIQRIVFYPYRRGKRQNIFIIIYMIYYDADEADTINIQ